MIPWSERINMLSINPDAVRHGDVARMASDLGVANKLLAMWLSSQMEPISTPEVMVILRRETDKFLGRMAEP